MVKIIIFFQFEEIVKNYKCTSSKLQQTLTKIKEDEDRCAFTENSLREDLENDRELDENECLRKIIDLKTAENAKLFSRLLVTKVVTYHKKIFLQHFLYFYAHFHQICLLFFRG